MHWSDRYVGLQYVDGEFDCAALAELVQREVFSKTVHLPRERPYAAKKGSEKFEAMARQIEETKDVVAKRVAEPQDGDAIVLMSRGRPQHVGLYCLINGEPWVLHAADTSGQVVRCRLRQLQIWCMSVEGFYRWT
jgi:hypothetical protein